MIYGGDFMRVPKDIPSRQVDVKQIHVDKPIVIPRLPLVTNDKQRVKLIKTIESYCRASMEYGDLIQYLRKYVNMDQCTFLDNFKTGKKKGMVELHHAPYTLFSLVDIVMRKQEDQLGYIDEFLVAEEVMRLHYTGLVGLIPLSVTVHQLVHDGQMHIPLWCIYGRFVEFTKKYYDWIPDEILSALNEEIQLSRRFRNDPEALKENSRILKVQFVYLDVDGERKMQDGEWRALGNIG